METLQLKQNHRPLYAVQPERSHSRLSIRRVLYAKFLRWLDKATARALRKACLRFTATVFLLVLYLAPSFTLGILVNAMSWNTYRLPIGIAVFAFIFNLKTMYRFARRRRTTGNANMFHGVPVDEFASYLLEHGFKQGHTIKTRGLNNGRYKTIATRLDETKVCIRDENNGRQLNPHLTREQLVEQLRNDFPLVYDEARKEWMKRDGSFALYLRDEDARERKKREQVERLERRATKAKASIADSFTSRHVLA